jgi:hypothetical protein
MLQIRELMFLLGSLIHILNVTHVKSQFLIGIILIAVVVMDLHIIHLVNMHLVLLLSVQHGTLLMVACALIRKRTTRSKLWVVIFRLLEYNHPLFYLSTERLYNDAS